MAWNRLNTTNASIIKRPINRFGFQIYWQVNPKNYLWKHTLNESFNILPFLLHLYQGFFDFSCSVSCKSKYKLHILRQKEVTCPNILSEISKKSKENVDFSSDMIPVLWKNGGIYECTSMAGDLDDVSPLETF